MLGLFLLGLMSRRANNPRAIVGAVIGVLTIAWMTISPTWTGRFEPFRSPFHGFLTIVAGTVVILVVGWLVSQVSSRQTRRDSPAPAR